MCGIVGAFELKESAQDLRPQMLEMSKRIRHRGPDWSGIYCGDKAILAHERLAIVDPQSGRQPLYSPDRKLVLAVNGEIYNHQAIRDRYKDYDFQTRSDCEVILALYRDKGANFLEDLNGIFAFALYDEENDAYLISRDPIGVIPLYYGRNAKGTLFVASELKALEGYCTEISVFPPGYLMYSADGGKLVKWYKRDWEEFSAVKDNAANVDDIRSGLEDAVKRQLMTDVPYGVLLSGGLDSSIISAVAKKFSDIRVESEGTQRAWWPQLHSFAIGLKGAPDLKAAQEVADAIGTIHHEINFTIQEGLDALRDVIYHIETYDVTTVRASTPIYLLARVIKSMGIKMVLSGEGSDEIFGGYLYFHKAPNAEELHKETVRKIGKLYMYDCLRANKALAAWGVEGRVPFLDKEFLDIAMRFNPEAKLSGRAGGGKMEKYALRKAFEDYLPQGIVWRQKEQFSDGVGYSWIDSLKEYANQHVTDEQMAKAAVRFPINTPMTKEEYYYRSIFTELFPSGTAASTVPSEPSVACSTAAAIAWDESFKNSLDPSGRSVRGVHEQAYK